MEKPDGVHRMSQETREWIENCDVAPGRGRRKLENRSPSRVRCKKWETFARIALMFAGVVTALSDHFGRGAVFPPRLMLNPARR